MLSTLLTADVSKAAKILCVCDSTICRASLRTLLVIARQCECEHEQNPFLSFFSSEIW